MRYNILAQVQAVETYRKVTVAATEIVQQRNKSFVCALMINT